MSPRPIEVLPGARWVITSVDLSAAGLGIAYFAPGEGLKANGVVLAHSISIPHGDEYDEEIDAVIAAVTALLDDVLEDLPVMDAYAPPEDEEED